MDDYRPRYDTEGVQSGQKFRILALSFLGLYVVLILTLGLLFHRIGDTDVETDFYWSYAPQAQSVLEGRIDIDDFRGPVYPIILAASKLILGDFFKAGIVLSVASAGALLFFTYKVIEKLFRPGIALITTIAAAVNTPFVHYAYTVGTDMFCAALLMAVVYWVGRKDSLNLADMLTAGILSGCAFLTRYNAAAIFLGFFFSVVLLNTKGLLLKRRIQAAAMYSGGSLLVVAPWMIYSRIRTGEFLHQRNYLNVAFEMYRKLPMSWDTWWATEASKFQSFGDVVLYDPLVFAKRILWNIGDHFLHDTLLVVGIWLGALSIIGLAALFFFRPSRQQMTIFVFGACHFIFLLPVFFRDRFSLFLIPIYCVAAVLLVDLPRIASLSIRTIRAGVICLSLLLLIGIPRTITYNRQAIVAGPEEVLKIANVFAPPGDSSVQGQIVIARKPHIAYYLGMKFQQFPFVDSFEELFEQCRAMNVSYLYFSDVEEKLRPQFRDLLHPEKALPWLKVVAQVTDPSAVLYKIEY